MVGRFSAAALAQWQAQAVSTPVGTPLKYGYTPDNRLGPNSVEQRLASPARLEVTGTTVLLALAAGWLLRDFVGGGIGSAFKGRIARRIGG